MVTVRGGADWVALVGGRGLRAIRKMGGDRGRGGAIERGRGLVVGRVWVRGGVMEMEVLIGQGWWRGRGLEGIGEKGEGWRRGGAKRKWAWLFGMLEERGGVTEGAWLLGLGGV